MWGGGSGSGPPLHNKAIGFPSNTGWDPLENQLRLSSHHSMSSHHWPANETPFKWRFVGGPMMARF